MIYNYNNSNDYTIIPLIIIVGYNFLVNKKKKITPFNIIIIFKFKRIILIIIFLYLNVVIIIYIFEQIYI